MAYTLNAILLLVGIGFGLYIAKYQGGKHNNAVLAGTVIVIAAFLVGSYIGRKFAPAAAAAEGFEGVGSSCPDPDPSLWVLKATVPPCPPMPDMSKYMLKTECPPLPDMSKYVLKSSVPKCPPCISTCSKPCKIGECPPCPRPRCPVVKCPEPKACPACPVASCAPCPEPKVKCNATYEPVDPVRPMLASTATFGY
jgi:hypothetical protein